MTTLLEKPKARRVSIVGRAAVYLRVSTDRQAENGASLEVQREACLRYCSDHGLDVVGEFQDVMRGGETERPQYRKALELATSGGIEKLIVWRLDRLGRDAAEYIGQLKNLKRIGIDVVSVTQPSESMFMQQMLGVMAEEESRQLSVRVTASKQRRYKEGYWGGPAPFGYDSVKQPEGGSILVPNADAPLVTEMFSRYASGKHSLSDLRDYLNSHGHRRHRFFVYWAMKNSVYAGKVRHGIFCNSAFQPKPERTEVKGKHEPLTTREIFERVQERLKENAHRQRGGVRPRYLFSGLVFCGTCGRRYCGMAKVRKGREIVNYRCNRANGVGDCLSHSIAEPRIKMAVIPPIEALLGVLGQEAIRKAVREELERQQRDEQEAHNSAKADLIAAQEKLEGRLSRLEDGWLDGAISKQRYLARRDEIEVELSEIKRQLTERPAQSPTDVSGVLSIAEGLTVADLDNTAWRDIIEGLVDKIEIVGEKRKKRATVRVHWREGFEAVKELAEAMSA
jgi:site-specific DNA recombinase